MSYLSARIVFEGFEPDAEAKSMIRLAAEKIAALAPSDGSLHLAIKKEGPLNFITVVKVVASIRSFVAEGAAASMTDSFQQSFDEIQRKIAVWKKGRWTGGK